MGNSAYARQVDALNIGVMDAGVPVSLGTATLLLTGTQTEATLYTERDKGSTTTNPVDLDADGKAFVYCDDIVDILVKDAAGTTLYTIEDQDLRNPYVETATENQYEFVWIYGRR